MDKRIINVTAIPFMSKVYSEVNVPGHVFVIVVFRCQNSPSDFFAVSLLLAQALR